MAIKLSQNLSADRQETGLRSFFGRVYYYMTGSLVLSGLSAYAAAHTAVFGKLFAIDQNVLQPTLLGWIVMFAPLILILMMHRSANRMNLSATQSLFWGISVLNGLSMSVLTFIYTQESVVQAFFVAAASFLALSIWGSSTQKNLSGVGSFCFMGVIGVIIASIVNIFMASSVVALGISVIGVLVFAGLVAYDTQRLKALYYESMSSEQREIVAVTGALSLYLEFVNLFQLILNLTGERR